MAILHLLTLGLTAAAMASPAPSNDATPTDPKEALVRKNDWDNYLKYKASLGTQASGQAAVQRICDLVLCLGPNHTGECSLWCHYKGKLQSFEEAKQREITMSTYFTKSDRCNFYASGAKKCDIPTLMSQDTFHQLIYHGGVIPEGNFMDGLKGKMGCVVCSDDPNLHPDSVL
ncbi:hypothetical protein CABS01_13331 [Colletotrichum abscissum]|uniref:Uncharacterized protein n=1 Tax=Colletotrichum abscissum TaxID=1671311 RepID=A0A9P9X6S9_9PEZI|nr:uncharacterized protein CABS01_13331 [Colletotrichum abscissum]KAI3538741.1 hypothetical protein CABS02_11705 [Colletotrichum abscissum]KAK1486114.1 hypothetical protein CABS01_13331 [Colletotrichum abscissum]